jgi:hypothetical protein
MVSKSYRHFVTAALASLVSVAGCFPSYEEPTPKVEGEYLVHVVHGNGENIQQLAKWYTGSEENVAAMRRANKGISSGELKKGRKVFIPINLVVQTEPPLLVLPTPTPAKLIVITEPTKQAEQPESSDGLEGVDLERFEEELGPADSKEAPEDKKRPQEKNTPEDKDVMVLKGAPTVPAAAAAPKTAAAAAAVVPQPAPTVAPTALPSASAKSVDDFESQVDKLLLKEQAELDQLRRELSAGAAKPAVPVRRTPRAKGR